MGISKEVKLHYAKRGVLRGDCEAVAPTSALAEQVDMNNSDKPGGDSVPTPKPGSVSIPPLKADGDSVPTPKQDGNSVPTPKHNGDSVPTPPSPKTDARPGHASYETAHPTSFWLWVMCLTGVDYFSTLGYQPAIAFENAGMLAPLATVVLVLVTLFGALPVYSYVAGKSFEGQGSIGMLARLVSGWPGKILILTLLGFAATDFVITKTLSAADAAEHMIQNPRWPLAPHQEAIPAGISPEQLKQITEARHESEDRQRLIVTFILLIILGAMFLRGFTEVIGLAVVIASVFLLLNLIVVGNSLLYLLHRPDLVELWLQRLHTGDWHIDRQEWHVSDTSWWTILALSLLVFPKLALGLSGFETGVAVMPLIRGYPGDTLNNPLGRIRNTQKLLLTAALIMSCFLLTSSLVVCTLIPPDAFVRADTDDPLKKYAKDRALAYLAHGDGPHRILWSGETLGTLYDLSTVVILWFAGASAMAGLLNLVPRYLPRYGMAPEWARAVRPLVMLFTGVNLLVTWIFDASVSAQGGAYATGVLVLITSACIATVIEKYREREGAWYRRFSPRYTLILLVFIYTTIAVVIEKPEGIKIATCFVIAILVVSVISRISRSRELRFTEFHLVDAESKLFWDTIRAFELSVLVPHRPGRRSLSAKEAIIRREHRIPRDMMMVFIEVTLSDASEFVNEPNMEIRQEEGRYIIRITRAASIAHTIAAVALEMAKVGRPPEIHFGWTDESPLSGTLGFLLFGEGNVPWMVRDLIRRAEPDPSRRPLIIIAGT